MTDQTNRHGARRPWVPDQCEDYIDDLAHEAALTSSEMLERRISGLVAENRRIHEHDCFNLNPATNVMNPKAEAVLAQGLGSRPSLGYPGDKYEMGLEAVEKIEIVAAELACEIFQAKYAEIRVASGALANLYAFMATTKAGDPVIVPPPEIGGHVTHHQDGAAGLFGVEIHAAPVDAEGYTIDIDGLRERARAIRPKLITVGGSLNLFPHPVADIRAIADEVGAYVLFDAAHLCGMIAGRTWANPLNEGAHMMTMSTYKSLGGPAGGLILTNEPELAQRLDGIAFPGLTANFDAAKSAALAITLLDWRDYGAAYADQMVKTAKELAWSLDDHAIPVFAAGSGFTTSHQFAVEAIRFGGGQTVSKKLRQANLLACGIGLPVEPVAGDMNGLRIGTPELVRWGVMEEDARELGALIARALKSNDPAELAAETTEMRARYKGLYFVR